MRPVFRGKWHFFRGKWRHFRGKTGIPPMDRLTGHTSGAGTAPYRRDEITKSLAQDRAAAVAVMSPVEILFQFTGDRTQGQQITVRLDASFARAESALHKCVLVTRSVQSDSASCIARL
eukprot:COSAG06_NODE_388_length_16429_cov_129.962094_2_plen_119_part_00